MNIRDGASGSSACDERLRLLISDGIAFASGGAAKPLGVSGDQIARARALQATVGSTGEASMRRSGRVE